MSPVRLAILTVSDAVSRGARADESGDLIAGWAASRAYDVVARSVVPDEPTTIAERLAAWTEDERPDLILTTGGTGFTTRDLTPEATRTIIEREAPGIAEAIRYQGARSTPYAWLSRGIAGIRRATLIINLPGSTGGVRDGLAIIDQVLPHAVQLLRGIDTDRHEPVIARVDDISMIDG